jgi:hypothetical protein
MELHPETRWGYASLKNLIQFRDTEVSLSETSDGNVKDFVSDVSEGMRR